MERGERGGTNRQRERELERKREVNTKVNYMDIHVHSRII